MLLAGTPAVRVRPARFVIVHPGGSQDGLLVQVSDVDLKSERLPRQRVHVALERSSFANTAILEPGPPGSEKVTDVHTAPASLDKLLALTALPFTLGMIGIEVVRHDLQVGGKVSHVVNSCDVHGQLTRRCHGDEVRRRAVGLGSVRITPCRSADLVVRPVVSNRG